MTEEGFKAVGSVVSSIGTQPLALALVIMNLTLLGYLFYLNSSVNSQRKDAVTLIMDSQRETEKLLANCVSGEVTRTMLDNMQKITETMLAAEQKEITRMQDVVNTERQRSFDLRQREQKELDEFKRRETPETPPRMQRMSAHSAFFPLPPLPDMPVLRAIHPDVVPWK